MTGPQLEPERSATLASLRLQLADLDARAGRVERSLDDLRAQCRPIEQRAMTAIRIGDDRAARGLLDELRTRLEAAAPMEADLKVLRAIVTAYRQAIETVDSGSGSPDAL